MAQAPLAKRLAALTALDDPIRRELFELISSRESPIGRDEAARELGINRSTAAFHLDRLAEEGLLDVQFKRLSGKTGPGSGRPAKLYCRADEEVSVSIPERQYELAGELMATAIEESSISGEPVRTVLLRIAAETGRSLAGGSGTLEGFLEDHGYEPRLCAGGKDIVMGNCPFHGLVSRHSDIVCALNVELLRGAATAMGDTDHEIHHEPGAGRCCVLVTRTRNSQSSYS